VTVTCPLAFPPLYWHRRPHGDGTVGAPEACSPLPPCDVHGQILARLVISSRQDAERLAKMGVKDTKRIYDTEDLAPGKKIIFALLGVTDGTAEGRALLRRGHFARLHDSDARRTSVRFVDSVRSKSAPTSRSASTSFYLEIFLRRPDTTSSLNDKTCHPEDIR